MNECITALEYEGGITAIDSGMVRPQMAACYLLETGSAVAVIETGNAASAERILKVAASRGRDPEEISHVIVTHVHLDHAGGAGTLMQRLPQATLVVHPRGARHLIDPSKLEASARAVYGDEKFDEMYGTLLPVPEDRVRIMEDGDSLRVGGRTLEFMDAPGHARHHFTIWDEETRGWFTGDTFGLSYRELDTGNGAFLFPTTTPIQFDPPALIDSVDRMMARDPERMYLTHFGRVQDLGRLADDMRAGVDEYVELAKRFEGADDRARHIEEAMMARLMQRARNHGVTLDDEKLRETFAGDVVLNTQGIEFWLEHGRR
ncbi:MAG: MBL fold metallo-hydrolase [Gammaproteobacteria bacterium]|nr:MBL fold metallo-hydrolase [Gammaproteobacteria bacterium]